MRNLTNTHLKEYKFIFLPIFCAEVQLPIQMIAYFHIYLWTYKHPNIHVLFYFILFIPLSHHFLLRCICTYCALILQCLAQNAQEP